jgi:hypothetical protein
MKFPDNTFKQILKNCLKSIFFTVEKLLEHNRKLFMSFLNSF